MKVVFLDVDGVLNNEEDIIYLYDSLGGIINKSDELKEEIDKQSYGQSTPFSKRNLNNLLYIIKETDSCIVLTSTWRLSTEGKIAFSKALASIGIEKNYIGNTKSKYFDSNWGRGREITEWLKESKDKINIDNYVILDDDADMHWGDCMKHFINVNGQVGLTNRDACKAIKLLKGELYEEII